MFKKIFKSLSKTRDLLFNSVQNLIGLNQKLDDEMIKNLERTLLLSDIGVKTTSEILSKLKENYSKLKIDEKFNLKHFVNETIQSVFQNSLAEVNLNSNKISNNNLKVILIVGVNGVGKTTSIGKLSYKLSSENKNVVIGSGDTFRAAANEQLSIWATRANVKIIQNSNSNDPASVAFETINYAKNNNADYCIIDTAGRLHTKSNLMDELKKIKRVIAKVDETAPHEILFVLDATNGQNGLMQAIEFNKSVDLTGVIVTKLDGTAKGGIVLSIVKELKIPVKYIGVGEGIEDFEEFNSTEFINSILPKEEL